MKMIDLLESKFPELSDSEFDEYMKLSTSDQVLGTGIEATVVTNPGKPYITKILTMGKSVSLADNAYMQYMLDSKKYHNENPYFPNVYNIRQYGKYQIFYFIDMEHLTPLTGVDNKVLTAMASRVFDIDYEVNGPYVFSEEFRSAIQNRSLDRLKRTTKDPYFIKFVAFLNKRILPMGANLDIHSGNMMVRPTGYGPQLVFTDPVHKW